MCVSIKTDVCDQGPRLAAKLWHENTLLRCAKQGKRRKRPRHGWLALAGTLNAEKGGGVVTGERQTGKLQK